MKPFLVGVTGGIGSGKSVVCRILELMGVPVYNADNASKILLEEDPAVVKAVKHLIGLESYDEHGKPNRSRIAEVVFNDPERLKELNAILHPAVREDFRNWVGSHQEFPILIKDAAILFESGSNKELDFIVTISAPETLRVNRVMKRDAKTAESIYRIIKEQLPQDSLIEKSNFVLYNDEQSLVIPQILELLDVLKKLTSDRP